MRTATTVAHIRMARRAGTVVIIALCSIAAAITASVFLVRAPARPAPARAPSPGVTNPGRQPTDAPSPRPRSDPGRRSTGVGRGGSAKMTDRFDEIDAALEQLVTGRVAFNSPERMHTVRRRRLRSSPLQSWTGRRWPESCAPALAAPIRFRSTRCRSLR